MVDLIDDVFIPIGFKRKGSNWVSNGEELSKVINLQRSYYSKSYYINYGYIIKGLELTTREHVMGRLGSIDTKEQKRITELLNLETNIEKNQRLTELKNFLVDKMVSKMQKINTQEDLLNNLKGRPHLNDIPGVVKNYFDLK